MLEAGKSRRQVTVDLVDLKSLVWMLFDQKVSAQAQTIALTAPGQSDPSAALEFAHFVEKATPEATSRMQLQFGELLRALERGTGVEAALSSFVHGYNPSSQVSPS